MEAQGKELELESKQQTAAQRRSRWRAEARKRRDTKPEEDDARTATHSEARCSSWNRNLKWTRQADTERQRSGEDGAEARGEAGPLTVHDKELQGLCGRWYSSLRAPIPPVAPAAKAGFAAARGGIDFHAFGVGMRTWRASPERVKSYAARALREEIDRIEVVKGSSLGDERIKTRRPPEASLPERRFPRRRRWSGGAEREHVGVGVGRGAAVEGRGQGRVKQEEGRRKRKGDDEVRNAERRRAACLVDGRSARGKTTIARCKWWPQHDVACSSPRMLRRELSTSARARRPHSFTESPALHGQVSRRCLQDTGTQNGHGHAGPE
ncbi:hypothetical protein C8R45DRAFT_924254 [Mycena sanguinolenta]|nr:hypothetical protein C8R45DRAFT_924254 [Mycena sanguinolenta]